MLSSRKTSESGRSFGACRAAARVGVGTGLDSATDTLLKHEFDAVRVSGQAYPIWEREGRNVRAYGHPDLEIWHSNFNGICVVHAPTSATISGAVDDIWQHRSSGELHIVDYKSTSKQGAPDLESGFGLPKAACRLAPQSL